MSCFRGATCGVVVVGALLGCVALRGLFIERRAVPGQFRHAYFERSADREVRLTLDDRDHSDVLPRTHVDQRGVLYLPPGRTAGIPLEPGRVVWAHTDAPDLAPPCLFGVEEPLGGEPAGAFRLSYAHVLAATDGGMVFIPWEPEATLRDDHTRLRVLRERCTHGPEAKPVSALWKADGSLEVGYGHCVAVLPGASGGVAMAIVAGTFPATVERDGGWDTRAGVDRTILAGTAILSFLAAVGLALAFGRPAAPATGLVLVLASLLAPAGLPTLIVNLAVLAGLVIAVAASLCVGLYLAVSRLLCGRSVPIRAGAFLAVIGVLAVATSLAGRPGAPGFSPKDFWARGERPSCVLAGYSTANNNGLRDREGGVWGRLAVSCAGCPGGTARYSSNGQTFPFIRDFLCAPDAPLAAGQTVIFLGGINDDLLYEVNRAAVGRLIATLFVGSPSIVDISATFREPTSSRFLELQRLLASDVLHRFAVQEEVLREGLCCARERGLRVLYLHDFLLTDFPGGPPPERAEMRKRRRVIVEGFGARFVSLADRYQDEVGLSWFNDYIHLSEVGHERVAELVCSTLAGTP